MDKEKEKNSTTFNINVTKIVRKKKMKMVNSNLVLKIWGQTTLCNIELVDLARLMDLLPMIQDG